jgi:2-amino-4-hydroxy-6-hydroxymethyldihydropteridine diphosphokinase
MHTIYLALGTNLGDRMENLRHAVAALPPVIHVTALSFVYETPPWGYADQPAFLNQVIAGSTPLDPPSIHALIKRIETGLGRQPTFRYGPRLIDIDILSIGSLVMDTLELVIPHPRLQERAFVLVPLAEIAPDWVHPVLHLGVKSLLEKVDASGVKLYPSAP